MTIFVAMDEHHVCEGHKFDCYAQRCMFCTKSAERSRALWQCTFHSRPKPSNLRTSHHTTRLRPIIQSLRQYEFQTLYNLSFPTDEREQNEWKYGNSRLTNCDSPALSNPLSIHNTSSFDHAQWFAPTTAPSMTRQSAVYYLTTMGTVTDHWDIGRKCV